MEVQVLKFNNYQFSRKQMNYAVLCVLSAFLLVLILQAIDLDAKTLTNQDIKNMKRQYQKNTKVPTKNTSTVPPADTSYSNPGKPMVPAAPGVPPVPGSETPASVGAVVVKKHLPYKDWDEEYKEYFDTHYRSDNLWLKPKMIVLHYSGTDNFAKLWYTFLNGNDYDGKKGHLSVHYVIDKDGTIYELIPANRRARGTYGVNHVAISIDLVAKNENDLLNHKKQMQVSFGLVRWLMKKFKIPKEKVLSHTEVAKGKELVAEYTDFADQQFPDRYPPGANVRGPGKAYMFKLRYFLVEPR